MVLPIRQLYLGLALQSGAEQIEPRTCSLQKPTEPISADIEGLDKVDKSLDGSGE
jgi:hypothetical protein